MGPMSAQVVKWTLVLLLLGSVLSPAQPPPRLHFLPQSMDRPRPGFLRMGEMPFRFTALPGPQVGVNFVRFFWDERAAGFSGGVCHGEPSAIFEGFAGLGATAYRQFVKADLLWDVVEPGEGMWKFSNADAIIPRSGFTPIPTLFLMQYASPNPPWEKETAVFRKTIGPEAKRYIETVVRRYARYVKYWEIGNEMGHWRAADPGDEHYMMRRERLPAVLPGDGFSPREQGAFLAQVAAIIRACDPDAVILLPGMPGLNDDMLETWLPGILAGGGRDCFDIVNYHDYSDWKSYSRRRLRLAEAMKRLGIADKPVWQTETGSSSDPTLSIRTDYPNSLETQAADVFRRLVQGYGYGDSLVLWHCYLSSPSSSRNEWRGYGLLNERGETNLAGHAYALFTRELIPWSSVERIESDPRGRHVYRFILPDGTEKTVAWGTGSYLLPAKVTQYTSVIPSSSGVFHWQKAPPGGSLSLSPNPVLLK